MNNFIFGTRIKTDIIDLDRTVTHLQRALNFTAHVAFRKGIILMFTRYPQHMPLIERTAKETGEYAYCRPWVGGQFTDSTRSYGSVIRLPDLCLFFHAQDKMNEPHPALVEIAKMLIPTVAICDTDIDPSQVTYPVPGNDDSMVSQQLYAKLFKEAILRGKRKRTELEAQGYHIEIGPAVVA
jgi:small subunit ribosomal protein S2